MTVNRHRTHTWRTDADMNLGSGVHLSTLALLKQPDPDQSVSEREFLCLAGINMPVR